MSTRGTQLSYQVGLLGFTRFSNVLALIHKITEVERQFIPRLLVLILLSAISVPLRLLEAIIWGARLQRVKINDQPLFILGHWRSGTTHLHNLLIQDKSFGFVSMYQSIAPECTLIGGNWLRQLLASTTPLKRPMDNMSWPIDAPQEDEFALSKMLPWAFYISLLFPKNNHQTFLTATRLDDEKPEQQNSFINAYRKLLAIATLGSGGRPLTLKNPVNTARIKILLKLFPNARFIHIARNPYDVFTSTQEMYKKLGSLTRLQTLGPEEAKESILSIYAAMMRQYFIDRSSIPAERLVEVRFEELEREPLQQLMFIYQKLGLTGFELARPSFEHYIDEQKSYIKNKHHLTDADRTLINNRWGFAFPLLGYKLITT